MKIQMSNKERKSMVDNLVKDTVTGIVILAIFLIIGMIPSCTTTQDLPPTETHDWLIDKTTLKQTWAKKPETGRKFYDYDSDNDAQ